MVFRCIFVWFLDMRLFYKILDIYRIFYWSKIYLVLLRCNLAYKSRYSLNHQCHIKVLILITMLKFWELKRQWINLKTKLNVWIDFEMNDHLYIFWPILLISSVYLNIHHLLFIPSHCLFLPSPIVFRKIRILHCLLICFPCHPFCLMVNLTSHSFI